MRILHVGNIANNAYLAAAWDRDHGIEAYVASPDMYHVMSFPFWETQEIVREFESHYVNNEDQSLLSLNPSWFFYGTWLEIITKFNKSNLISLNQKTLLLYRPLSKIVQALWKFLRKPIKKLPSSKIINSLNLNGLAGMRILSRPNLRTFLAQFDVIVVYGPYTEIVSRYSLPKTISIEHGTLRDFVWHRSLMARRCLKGYANSDYIFVTNSDCVVSANRIGARASVIKSRHPVNSKLEKFRSRRQSFLNTNSPEFKILVPSRWNKANELDPGKGSELIIDVLKYFQYNNQIKFTLIKWGDSLPYYQAFLSKFGNFEWIDIQSRINLRNLIASSDVVLDQFVIPAFGGIAIDALGIGVPLITKVDKESEYCYYGQNSPAFTVDGLADLVKRIEIIASGQLDLNEYFRKATAFFDSYLHEDIAGSHRLKTYRELLECE